MWIPTGIIKFLRQRPIGFQFRGGRFETQVLRAELREYGEFAFLVQLPEDRRGWLKGSNLRCRRRWKNDSGEEPLTYLAAVEVELATARDRFDHMIAIHRREVK